MVFVSKTIDTSSSRCRVVLESFSSHYRAIIESDDGFGIQKGACRWTRPFEKSG